MIVILRRLGARSDHLQAPQMSIEALELRDGERLLLVGIGTAVDIPLLQEGVEAIGIDLTKAMLNVPKTRPRHFVVK